MVIWRIRRNGDGRVVQILKGAPVVEGRPGASMPLVDFTQLKKDLSESLGAGDLTDKDVVSAAMFPKEFAEFYRFRQEYGPVDKLDTPTFLVGPDVANEIQVSLFFSCICSEED